MIWIWLHSPVTLCSHWLKIWIQFYAKDYWRSVKLSTKMGSIQNTRQEPWEEGRRRVNWMRTQTITRMRQRKELISFHSSIMTHHLKLKRKKLQRREEAQQEVTVKLRHHIIIERNLIKENYNLLEESIIYYTIKIFKLLILRLPFMEFLWNQNNR